MAKQKEAQARIKINRLLEAAGWRFFDDDDGPANICLEMYHKLTPTEVEALGDDFERGKHGLVDFLLLDERGFPQLVLEAKAEDKNPLAGKEQARRYAKSLNCRFIILSNGNLHYLWDLARGNPHVITAFPTPESLWVYRAHQPHPDKLMTEWVEADYIALSQFPNYQQDAGWKNEAERTEFIAKNKLRFLRPYQLRAIQALQQAIKAGHDRFLFEMATGTGKTLTTAAIIRLFLRTGNVRRVLFLVDRLELEQQAQREFTVLLGKDYETIIYKEKREDWRMAEIVVTTVQSLLFNNKYKYLFSPTDFDLIISDEAHRSIGGNARAVFEYFVGYKLGLTATPKDYLKKFDQAADPREFERRVLLDTYRTFGCADGQPTFRYSLLDGVKDGYLINPLVVDARTGITTQLLSDKGYAAQRVTEEGDEVTQSFGQRDFERTFFSEATNELFCRTFLAHALRDPISGEIGKTIVFCVSQAHAAKVAQVLNVLADQMFPQRYQSDFAMQVTSQVTEAQQFAVNFRNNNLSGTSTAVPGYHTSKARVCVTVGMMTTGYDCPDLLNVVLLRPIFSPTDFIQIKGRGTRLHEFARDLHNAELQGLLAETKKGQFKLFDFFANCDYFEEKFNYDEVLKLPALTRKGDGDSSINEAPWRYEGSYENFDPDQLVQLTEQQVGLQGMKVDRMLFERFGEQVKADEFIKEKAELGQWEQVLEYVKKEVLDKPTEYFTLEKLRKAVGVDRRLSLREILEYLLGYIPHLKSKDELLEEEFANFLAEVESPDAAEILPMKYYFKAYATDARLREIIEAKRLADLHTNPTFSMQDFKAVPAPWRVAIPEYIKNYISINQFMN